MESYKGSYGSWHDFNWTERVIRTAVMMVYDESCCLKRVNTVSRSSRGTNNWGAGERRHGNFLIKGCYNGGLFTVRGMKKAMLRREHSCRYGDPGKHFDRDKRGGATRGKWQVSQKRGKELGIGGKGDQSGEDQTSDRVLWAILVAGAECHLTMVLRKSLWTMLGPLVDLVKGCIWRKLGLSSSLVSK